MYAGLINIYEPFISFCKMFNTSLDMTKTSYKVYFYFLFF